MRNISVRIILAVLLVASVAGAYECDKYYSTVNGVNPPKYSGTYRYIGNAPTTSSSVGDEIQFPNWPNLRFYQEHYISCKITDIEEHYDYGDLDYITQKPKKRYCREFTLYCDVSEKTQFYSAGVTYSQLSGYRSNGTLKWKREKEGSTDIFCYGKSGLYVVKRVNDPSYCN